MKTSRQNKTKAGNVRICFSSTKFSTNSTKTSDLQQLGPATAVLSFSEMLTLSPTFPYMVGAYILIYGGKSDLIWLDSKLHSHVKQLTKD